MPRHRVVADEPQEARLDEVVQLAVERAGLRRGRRARKRRGGARIDHVWDTSGSPGRDRLGRRCIDHLSSGLGPVRMLVGSDRLPWGAGGSGGGWLGHVSCLGERRAGGADHGLDVGGGHPVVGHGTDLPVGIFHHLDVARSERGQEGRPIALDLEQDEVRAHARRVQWAVRPAGPSRRPRRCRPSRTGLRRGAGRWRGPRPGDRSSRPGHRTGRPARPRRGRRPGASRHRPSCGHGARAR